MPMHIKSNLSQPAMAAGNEPALTKRIDWLHAKISSLSLWEIPAGYNVLFQLSVWLAGFGIIFSRRPDAILNSQFWAEDGPRWYADAYQFGWRCLLIPDELGGYFHSASRLAGLTSLAR